MGSGRRLRAIDRTILSLAWPVMVSNLLSALTGFVDMIMVGRLGAEAVASVGVANQLVFMVWAIAMGLGTGTVAMVARRHGEGDREGADEVLSQSMIGLLAISIPIVVVGLVFGRGIMMALTSDATLVEDAYAYGSIAFIATPFIFMWFTVTSALRGVGDTRTPMLIALALTFLNILLDYILIFGEFGAPALGVVGAALGTAASFIITLAIYMALLIGKRLRIGLRFGRPIVRTDIIGKMLHIGTPAGLEQFLLQLGFMMYFFFVASYGAEAIAAHSIGFRVQSLATNPSLGFAVAATALVGQGLGRKDPGFSESAAKRSAVMSVITMTLLGAVIVLAREPLASLFLEAGTSGAEETIELASTWIAIIGLGMPAIGGHFCLVGSLQGAGDTRWPLKVSFIGLYLVRLPMAFVLSTMTPLGIMGVWISLPLEYYLRIIIIYWRFSSGRWKSISV